MKLLNELFSKENDKNQKALIHHCKTSNNVLIGYLWNIKHASYLATNLMVNLKWFAFALVSSWPQSWHKDGIHMVD